MYSSSDNDNVPFKCHTDLSVYAARRLPIETQNSLLLDSFISEIKTGLLSVEETNIGLLMAEICDRSGRVSAAFATDFKDVSISEVHKLLIQQGARVLAAAKALNDLSSKIG